MPTVQPKPILNSALPPQFRKLHLVLAREPSHPEGDLATGYIIIVPLDAKDRIDMALWRVHREACRVTRMRPGQDDTRGHLVHRSGGGWAFHYDTKTGGPDEVGFHFADECFVVGEYVSINEDGKMHTYRVVSSSHL